MKSFFLTALAACFLFTACQSPSTPVATETEQPVLETPAVEQEEAVNEPAVETATDQEWPREPTDDEIREYGIITSIEDSPYPMFSIDVEFPERQTSASFSFNVEESPLDMEALMDFQEQYATIYYIIHESVDVFDIHANGTSLLGEDTPESLEGLKVVEGILGGADHTSGDLPSEIYVEDEQGKRLTFEYFVSDVEMAMNGKHITIYYLFRYRERITYLEKAED